MRYADGVEHGRQQTWEVNGRQTGEVSYDHGRLNGAQRVWLVDGTLVIDFLWENGVRVRRPGVDVCRGDLYPVECN